MAELDNAEAARRYLAAIERGAVGDELAAFFAPDVMQLELPNRLVPRGTTRNLQQLLASASAGQRVLQAQRFDVLQVISQGEQVALEVDWQGTFAVEVAGLPAGGVMRARFAIFLRYREGKIVAQHNYDCFEPW